jgi:molybdate transport system substrate-binding protein
MQPTSLFSLATASVILILAGCEHRETAQSPPAAVGPGVRAAQQTADQDAEMIILCGTSFGPPVEKLKAMFEEQTGRRMAISFGGSEDLLPHVKTKAQGDIFVTHDPYVNYTEEAGSMLRWVPVGFVAPVLVVKKGNPRQISKVEDLAQPGLKVLLTYPEYSTCGEMVFDLLDKKGIKEPVLKNVGNAMFRSHSDLGNKMKLGFGDAAIMWNGVAHNYLDAIEIVPGPYEYAEEIRVGVIGLSYSKHPQQVEEFLKFVEQHGPPVFEEFGYVK